MIVGRRRQSPPQKTSERILVMTRLGEFRLSLLVAAPDKST